MERSLRPGASVAAIAQDAGIKAHLRAHAGRPRRLLQVRKDLHMGQTIRFMNWRDGQMRVARSSR